MRVGKFFEQNTPKQYTAVYLSATGGGALGAFGGTSIATKALDSFNRRRILKNQSEIKATTQQAIKIGLGILGGLLGGVGGSYNTIRLLK